MGWSGGNEVFNAMAKTMQTAPYGTQLSTMSALIESLVEQDWDDANSALEDWKHVPAYVEAFKIWGYSVEEEEERVVEVMIYVHDDPDEGYDDHTDELTAALPWPPGDDRWNLNSVAYEIGINLEVEVNSGRTRIVGVNGTKLVEPLGWCS